MKKEQTSLTKIKIEVIKKSNWKEKVYLKFGEIVDIC